MSLHGSPGPSQSKPDRKSKKSAPTGASYTPPPTRGSTGGGYTPFSGSSAGSGAPKESKPAFGGFKLPGMGGEGSGGGLGNIWGPDATGPGFTSTWSEATKLMVAVAAILACLAGFGLLIFGVLKGKGTPVQQQQHVVTNLTKFVPQTTASGGLTDMPITFTDGTTADLLYDPSVDLANLGVSLSDSGTLGQFQRANLQFQIDHGGASYVKPATTSPGAQQGLAAPSGSNVPLLPAASDTPGNFLDFKFGDWHVGVWEGTDAEQMSASDDQAWAQNLTGTQTASGFLVLTAKGPLKLAPFGTPGSGPYLVFGDINTTGVILTPEACTPPVGKDVVNNSAGAPVRIAQNLGAHYEGYMCLPGGKMDVQIFGTNQFVTAATNSIDVKNIKAGPARPQ